MKTLIKVKREKDMPLQMKQFTIRFDPETGGLRRETEVVAFNNRVRKANACLDARPSNQDRAGQ